MVTIDFETEGIVGNPTVNPPVPVGVSIYPSDKFPQYLAWGHPTGNNTTYEVAKRELAKIVSGKEELVFHNAKFDLSVLWKHFGMTVDKLRVYDTQYDIFLTDPYSPNLALKPSAERLLGLPPDEQDAVKAWVLAHVPEARRKPSEWGAYICKAPGDLVGEYANGDVLRTWQIFEKQHPIINSGGMMPAYRREQRLLPILMASERRGIRVDLERLVNDERMYSEVLERCDDELRRLLKAPGLNIDSNEDLANALDKAGLVGEWQLTATGRRSTAKKALDAAIAHPGVLARLRYRGALSTCLSTFARPWVAQAAQGDGRVHTQWNQVRGPRDAKNSAGTRTGRLSSSGPNFQNIPNEFDVKVEGYPPLPLMRRYLLPEEGHVWCKRDFSSQEMRIAAHYAEGQLYEAYRADPKTDPHDFVKGVIREMMGKDLPRKHVKITGFQILYGGGAGAVAGQLGVSYDEGAELKETYFNAMPEMEKLSNMTRNRGRRGDSIRTWGGRVYYAEPPQLKDGRMREFSYKLLNYLIQGSAADLTKQAIIDWDESCGKDDMFLATVHDEINLSVPEDNWEESMEVLKTAMHKDHLDVPMLSDGGVGRNWQDLEECD